MRHSPSISVAAVVLVRDDGRIVLVRKHHTQAFMFPGGKPEPSEDGVATAVREVYEELGVLLDPRTLEHLGDFTTPAANEPNTQLLSQVYATSLPAGVSVTAQAEIAQLLWVDASDIELPAGTTLAPLSATILGSLQEPTGVEMTLSEFEQLVSEELDSLPEGLVERLDNVVFAVEDRPADGSLNVLGTYEGHDRFDRADYGYAQLPDAIVVFREPILAICDDVAQVRQEVHVTLVHEIGHYYGIDDAALHDLGWA